MASSALSMLCRGLLFALLISTPAIAADTDELPKDLPPAAGADERVKVLQLMRQNKDKYGGDVALMQGLLLTHSLIGQAVLATESTIVGFEQAEGRKYVAFRVASGVVFDDRELDREQRLERIWHVVLERTLLRYPSFTAPADGVAVEIEYGHRGFRKGADLYQNAADGGTAEHVKFYMLGSDVSAFIERRLGAQDFLEHSRILLDGEPVKLRVLEVAMPPAPAPNAPR